MTGQPTVRLPRPAEASHLLSDLLAHPLDPGYVEAARRRAEAGPRTGWRLLGARASTMAALVLVGFLFSVAYQRMVVDQPQAAKARADLIADVRDRRAETEAMQRDAEALRQDVA
ncbi:MAG: hypothetical protein JXA67_10805, partial [Micromonosporaceae bacterium]|nr:hypothetical protein [Micromonosporaceae bacterium]